MGETSQRDLGAFLELSGGQYGPVWFINMTASLLVLILIE